MPTIPASIRSNNPGAMWGKGNKIATKWGATATEMLNDGLGQGNNIAHFPTKLQGACAQLDLWKTGYVNMTLEAADKKWSGGNSSAQYINFLCSKVPGLRPTTVITPAFLASPSGWQLMKYQAQWEAGQPYPLTDTEWQTAQKQVFGPGAPKPTSKTASKTIATTTGAVATAGAAHQAAAAGASTAQIVAIIVAGVLITAAVWFLIHRKA